MILQKLNLEVPGMYSLSKTLAAHDGRGLIRRENIQIMGTSPRFQLHTANITAYEDNHGNLWAVTEHAHECLKKQQNFLA